MKRALFCGVAAIAVAAFLVATPVRLSAQSVPIDGKIDRRRGQRPARRRKPASG